MQSSINPTRLRQKQPRLKLGPEEYMKLRIRVVERDGWRCQECGSTENLEVHHMKPRSRLGDDVIDNLITLCAGCHGKYHGGRPRNDLPSSAGRAVSSPAGTRVRVRNHSKLGDRLR